MNIAELTEKTIDLSFEYENKGKTTSINLTVYEESLTPATFSRISQFEKQQDGMALSEALAGMIHAWDLDYNGAEFPPTVENISKCPFSFLTAVITAISETWAGKPQTPAQSVNGSARAAK